VAHVKTNRRNVLAFLAPPVFLKVGEALTEKLLCCFLWPERDEKMGLLKTILSGELFFADCAINPGQVELPVTFRKDYPRQNPIHVTNHICFQQRCLLLLTPTQYREMIEELLAAGQHPNVELLRTFLIGGAEEVQITNGKLPISGRLLNYLGAYLGNPKTATLCWLPRPPAATKARRRGKTARRRVLVPA